MSGRWSSANDRDAILQTCVCELPDMNATGRDTCTSDHCLAAVATYGTAGSDAASATALSVNAVFGTNASATAATSAVTPQTIQTVK